MDKCLPVLIVGAGPTGLLMACELARHHVPYRIIDKNPKPTATSNAIWIQPRTLEILEIMGVASHFTKRGQRCNAIQFYAQGKPSLKIPFTEIASPYPYSLMLPQSETERLLTDIVLSYGHTVERSAELIEIEASNTHVTSTIRHADKTLETIESSWVIACDGANSFIRNKNKETFQGEDLSEQFMVADVQMDSFYSHNEIHAFVDKKMLLIVTPLGTNKYKIIANLHQSHPRKFFIEKEVKEIVSERSHGSYNVHSVSWICPFWVHSKMIENMEQGRIFLAGDAAHIHSPVGGQGMNSGMQDAFNLAWKIAFTFHKKAKRTLLDSYQSERKPVMEKIVSDTEFYTKLALFDNHAVKKLSQFTSQFSKNSKILNKIAAHIAQIKVFYKNSPIIKYNDKKLKKRVKPGLRAPNVRIGPKLFLYHSLQNTQHNILLFTGINPAAAQLSKLIKLQAWLESNNGDTIKTHLVSIKELKDATNTLHDPDGAVHKRYNVKFPCIYVLRPDNYIAYYSRKLSKSALLNFLRTYLIL